MIDDLSALNLSSAMARHAGQVHAAVGKNISRADIPGATREGIQSFSDALNGLLEGNRARSFQTKSSISLDRELMTMAQNAGRHDAAVTIWAKSVDLVRLSVQAPR